MWQSLVVAVLVAGCGTYAAWTLSPKSLRSRVARALLQLQPTGWLRETLTLAANANGGCGCTGCDRSPLQGSDGKGATFQPLTFQPRTGSILRAKADQ